MTLHHEQVALLSESLEDLADSMFMRIGTSLQETTQGQLLT